MAKLSTASECLAAARLLAANDRPSAALRYFEIERAQVHLLAAEFALCERN